MDIVDEHLGWPERRRHRTAGTLRVYRLILQHFVEDMVQGRSLDDVTLEGLEQYIQRSCIATAFRIGGPVHVRS
jgi:hypothetical protein